MNPYNRPYYLELIKRYFRTHPVVAILGPRQCGKTTLSQIYARSVEKGEPVTVFDLEDPSDLQRLEDPKLALSGIKGLIVIDEIQRKPEIFPLMRVLVDRNRDTQRYLILGSASRELIRQSSESLAGRIAHVELTPFNITEIEDVERLWVRGGFPNAYLASSDEDSWDWRKFHVNNFLERDIPQLGFSVPAETMRRFWTMLAHCHGNILNSSELGRSLEVAHTTIKRYLDILVGTFMVRELKPWHENINKRQVKTSKVFLRDSGIYHYLMGIHNLNELRSHAKLGASWEGFALEEVIRHHQAEKEDCYFWSTHQGAELDLLIMKEGKRLGFEIKRTSTPKMTASMHTAREVLKLDSLTIIIPGKDRYPVAEGVEAIGLEGLERASSI